MGARAERTALALVAAALTAVAFAPLAGLLLRVWREGGYISGGDGLLVLDQMQYFNWLRQAGDHVLIGNLYDLEPGPRPFLHPGLLLSGGLERLGLGFIAAYLVWKPFAVAALFAGARAWCARFLPAGRDRVAAVAVAVLFASPTAPIFGWAGVGPNQWYYWFDFIAGEISPSNWLWGYLFTAVAVGLLPLSLLAFERDRLSWAAGAALLISWLQPWQGATLLLVLWAAERFRITRRLFVVGAAGTAPLLYYLVLSKTDDAWRLAGEANDFGSWPWWVTIVALAPLAVPALAGVRKVPQDFAGRALLAWPLAALSVYVLPFGTFPAHSWQGVALPLVVLAMLGWGPRLKTPVLVAVVALAIVPGTLYRADQMRGAVQIGRQPFFLTDGEREALRALEDDPRPGGVLAPIYSGLLVPAYTERETWVGAGSWSPDYDVRVQRAEALFSGRVSGAEAEALVRETGARFLLSDCHGRVDISRLVAGVVTGPPRRFGCAAVWEVRR